MTRLASTLIELVGIAAITWGCAQIVGWLGWIVGGLCLIVVGMALDPPSRSGS